MLVECRRGWGDLELPQARRDVGETGILEKPEWQIRL